MEEEIPPDENSDIRIILVSGTKAAEKTIPEENSQEAETVDVEKSPEAEVAVPEQQKNEVPLDQPDVPKDPQKPKKASRRRSSVGARLANVLIKPGTEDTFSPIDKPQLPIRPKRSIAVKEPPPRVLFPQKRLPARYSFDLGKPAVTKSCLKSSNRKLPPMPIKKSITQITANKVINKYRKSGSLTLTPICGKQTKLKFHNVCSIRVITPRPDYNPQNLRVPDDDDEKQLNPNRERLSTVKLQLTPTSHAQLPERQEGGVVQFNATMVFGDGQLNTLDPLISEGDVELDNTLGVLENSAPVQINKKNKSSRRKSLIYGSASPMKSPARIERPRFDDDMDESTSSSAESVVPRRSRRSVRLNKDAIEKPSEDLDVVLQERDDSLLKKRRHIPEETPIEPIPKRTRRKSAFFKKDDEIVNTLDDKKKTDDEKKGKFHHFFAPKKTEEKSKKPETKTINTDEKEKAQKDRRRTRRSSAYFGTAETKEDSDIVFVSESNTSVKTDSTTSFVASTSGNSSKSSNIASSSSSNSSESKESTVSMDNTLKSLKTGKVPSIFLKSPAQSKKVTQMKKDEASTSTPSSAPTTPTATSKLFSLFSPKPKVESREPPVEIIIPDSPNVESKSVNKSLKTSISVKRQEQWGDRYPETYEYILKMPVQQSIFEEEVNISDETLFNSRPFDEDILNVDNITSNLREIASEDTNMLIMEQSERKKIKKTKFPDKSCPTMVYPSTLDCLVEGSEEKEKICTWLKTWKRRVRKERELELKRQNKKQKNGSKRGRRRKDEDEDDDDDDDDSSSDYEMEAEDLENPLVLIGPTGVGKTALIKALALQEKMRIISIGPETDRSGVEIKKQLSEALRSHRVDQQPVRALSAFFKTIPQVEYKTKDALTEEPKEFVQSLIVFEHVDVFFDSLDRFGIHGLLEEINQSSVPVVFTCEKTWPRRIGQVELYRKDLEIRLNRNEKKVQKYVQEVVYSSRNVALTDSVISQLSESVNHDLKALLYQAHVFSLAPEKPFPLSSRDSVSNGFDVEWEKPRNSIKNEYENERLEELKEMYNEVLPNDFYPKLDKSWNPEQDRKLAEKQFERSEELQNAYNALNGRYSKRVLIADVLPLLVPIDRIEREKKARRHLHRFKELSDIPTDGDALISVVRRCGFEQV